MNPYIGEIRLAAFTFAPSGWAFCQGQLLPIAGNAALYSLLGTTYGGDGKKSFALPNLQSVIAVGFGQGPGLSYYGQGDTGGVKAVTVLSLQMPGHTHTLPVSSATGQNAPSPTTFLGGAARGGAAAFATPQQQSANPVTMAYSVSGMVGGNGPHNNMAPFLSLNYIIATSGIFPTRP